MAETLIHRLYAAAEAGPGKGLRFVDAAERQTDVDWPEVLRRAEGVAGALQARGVRPGDTVALIYPTDPSFFDAFFGLLLIGAVPVPLYPPVRLGRLDEYHAKTAAMLQAAQVRLVVAHGRAWRIIGETILRARPALGCVRAEDLTPAPFQPGDQGPEQLALVQFSSGTTVAPKPVAISHANILANIRAILQRITEGRDMAQTAHVGVSWLPLYHDMGLTGCVFPALDYPGSLYLIGPEVFITKPALWLRTLSRTQALVSPAPNFAYSYCVDRIKDEELDGVDLSRWYWALNGAEPVAPATLRRFIERFQRWGFQARALTPVYGLAEATLAVTFAINDEQGFQTRTFDRDALAQGRVVPAPTGVELATVGRPLPDVEVEAPVDVVGPVRVRGPSVMVGYLHQPERTAAAIHDGWLDTGDLGFLHQGDLYITGREKDLLILRGRNHAPHDIEQAVDVVPDVRVGCAAAVGYMPEGAEGEELLVFVETAVPTDEQRLACAKAILAATGLIAEVHLVAPGTLPRTSSGKIRRGEALRLWLSGALQPPAPVSALRMVGALAQGTLAHWRSRG